MNKNVCSEAKIIKNTKTVAFKQKYKNKQKYLFGNKSKQKYEDF